MRTREVFMAGWKAGFHAAGEMHERERIIGEKMFVPDYSKEYIQRIKREVSKVRATLWIEVERIDESKDEYSAACEPFEAACFDGGKAEAKAIVLAGTLERIAQEITSMGD